MPVAAPRVGSGGGSGGSTKGAVAEGSAARRVYTNQMLLEMRTRA
jgi:hypothetical protein